MAFLKFVLAMFLSFIPGILGVIVTPINTGENAWYNTLNHSALTPAGWVFSGVWSVLYFFIGVALFMIMQAPVSKHSKNNSYVLFAINLIFNTAWSFVFFGMHMPEVALLVLALMIVTAVLMTKEFFKIDSAAGWLVVPYVLWLLFAIYLNWMIVYLN